MKLDGKLWRIQLLLLALGIFGLWTAGAGGFLRAQDPVVYTLTGEKKHDELGVALATLGDLDDDGVPDFAAGAYDNIGNLGYLHVVSGRTGKIIYSLHGEKVGAHFGSALGAIGDIDGDQKTDFATNADGPHIIIYSGKDGARIRKIEIILTSIYEAATSIVGSPDIDGDGVSDFFLSDYSYSRAIPLINLGRVSAYSGKKRSILWTWIGEKEHDWFGYSIAAIGDVDGDGLGDVAAGRPRERHDIAESTQIPGEVLILRGKDGALLLTLGNLPRHFNFGEQLATLGDVDSDGFSELAVAAPGYAGPGEFTRGWVGVYSTRTFDLLWEVSGLNPYAATTHGDALGHRLGAAGDVNGDRLPDLLIAAEDWREAFDGFGRIDLRSGKNGALLASYQIPQGDERYLGSLSPLGDLDGDGKDEFLIGAINYPPRAGLCDQPGECLGTVFAMRFEASLPLFLRGDANADGRADMADAIFILEHLHLGGPAGDCLAALDVTGSDEVNDLDVVALLRHFFMGGFSPAPPFPTCGRFGGLRKMNLGCERSACQESE
ncbi:MAG: FG-GAP repeat protein [Planctomycetes bacterium]|nr:FG-GAP repeat protein [Planctomycetota bacterium]